jgi:hypothetical protein
MQNNIDKEWAEYCGLTIVDEEEYIGTQKQFEKFNDEELKAKWLEQNETF